MCLLLADINVLCALISEKHEKTLAAFPEIRSHKQIRNNKRKLNSRFTLGWTSCYDKLRCFSLLKINKAMKVNHVTIHMLKKHL